MRPAYNRAMDWLHEIALAAGLAWASGIRLYAALLIAGALAHFGWLELPPALEVLKHPLVIGAAGVMALGEFLADKVPAFDSAWDAVHTFIRVPAGAFLAAAALGQTDPVWIAVAAILGGAIASGTHLTKAGTRALINASPEPFSNWTASVGEDVLVPVGLLAAIKLPALFLGALAVFLIAAVWLLPKLFRAAARTFRALPAGAADAVEIPCRAAHRRRWGSGVWPGDPLVIFESRRPALAQIAGVRIHPAGHADLGLLLLERLVVFHVVRLGVEQHVRAGLGGACEGAVFRAGLPRQPVEAVRALDNPALLGLRRGLRNHSGHGLTP
jgi:hypothetical protein